MKHCLPDELFNRIDYPLDDTPVALDGLYREIAYKLPGEDELTVRKEAWHALVDFCARTGAMLERDTEIGQGGSAVTTCEITPSLGAFLRIVKVETKGADDYAPWVATSSFTVGEMGSHYAVSMATAHTAIRVTYSVRPKFDDTTKDTSGKVWEPKAPTYVIERYGECIAHGALARLYAMRGEEALARMHATAYNNDLNRLSFGLLTSGMRKHLLIDIEDWLVNTTATQQG